MDRMAEKRTVTIFLTDKSITNLIAKVKHYLRAENEPENLNISRLYAGKWIARIDVSGMI